MCNLLNRLITIVLLLPIIAHLDNVEAETPLSNCGQVILMPGKYKLSSDLFSCPGDPSFFGAITILSSGVDLDLDGHSITCDLVDGLPNLGIVVFSASDVTVKNGSISSCDVGLDFFQVTDSRVVDLVVTGNWQDPVIGGGYGIFMNFGAGNRIVENILSENQISGLSINESFENTVVGNEVARNGLGGIALSFFSTANVVRGNTVESNGVVGIGANGYVQLGVPIPVGNSIQGNVVTGHPFDLAEFLFDPSANPPLIVNGECGNNWKSNNYESSLGPDSCFD